MAQIELRKITHSYRRKPRDKSDYALKKIQHTWEDGGAYALLGPSGCGKTTLLNIISGLLTPSDGQVLFDRADVTGLPPEKRNIAQVFQFPVLYDTMSVFDNLAFPLRNRKVNETDVAKRVHEIADILDLSGFLKQKAANLTADAKQKISLGRGLVRSDVAAILFDEPLTVIDPHLKWSLRRKLKEIHEQLKLTFIYVTHDQVEAMTFAEKVVVMNEGEILQIGTPQELFEAPEHTFVGYFIGSPGMNFISCRVDGTAAVFQDGEIPLSPESAELAHNAAGKLEIGIRPMHLDLCADAKCGGLKARPVVIEDQGNAKIVTAKIGETVIRARVAEDQPVPERDLYVVFPTEKIKLYEDGILLKESYGRSTDE